MRRRIFVSGAGLVDYNRAGTALMEIVSHPCMHSADDACVYDCDQANHAIWWNQFLRSGKRSNAFRR